MLGMIKNALFGSVETWPWQVLSKGDKVGPPGCRGPEVGCAPTPHPDGPERVRRSGGTGVCPGMVSAVSTALHCHTSVGRAEVGGRVQPRKGLSLPGGRETGERLIGGESPGQARRPAPVECIHSFKHSHHSEHVFTRKTLVAEKLRKVLVHLKKTLPATRELSTKE